MQIINNRYRVVALLKETDNSLLYVVRDSLTDMELVLKMLNPNTSIIPLDYFKKEYVFNASISHPFIRSVFDFQRCHTIDGNQVVDPCYFYCADFYPSIGELSPEKEHTRDVIEALTFLHNNLLSHGDLSENNIFIANNEIKIIDLSPMVPHKIGIDNDLRYMQKFCKDKVSFSDPKNHLFVLKSHLGSSNFPLRFLSPKHFTSLLSSYLSSYAALLCANAPKELDSLSHELLIEDEIAGRIIIPLTMTDPMQPFSIFIPFLKFCSLFPKARAIIESHRHTLSAVMQECIETTTTQFAPPSPQRLFYVFEEILSQIISTIPVTLFISWDALDLNSKTIINTLIGKKNHNVRFLATGTSSCDFGGEILQFPVFTRRDYEKILRYYLYFCVIPPFLTSELYEFSHGSISKTIDILSFLLSNTALSITSAQEYAFNDTISNYILSHDDFCKLFNDLPGEAIELLAAISFFSKFPNSIMSLLPQEYSSAYHLLQKKNMISVFGDYCSVFMGDFAQVAESPPYGKLFPLLRQYIEANVLQNIALLIPYQRILFLTSEYDLLLSLMRHLYLKYEQGSVTLKLDAVFTHCLRQLFPFVNSINPSLRFFYFSQIVRWKMSDFIPIEEALREMCSHASCEGEHIEYLTERILQDDCGIDELSNIHSYFLSFSGALFNKKWRLLFNYVGFLFDKGMVQDAFDCFQRYMPSISDKLTPSMSLDNLIMISGLSGRLGDANASLRYLLDGLRLIEANPLHYSDTQKFKIYNNLFVYYQNEDAWDNAIYYAGRAYDIATIIDDPRSLALICNNIGAMYANINNYPLSFEYFEKSHSNAIKARATELTLLSAGNLVEMYLTTHAFDRAFDLYTLVTEKYFYRSPVLHQKISFLTSGLKLFLTLGLENDVAEMLRSELFKFINAPSDLRYLSYYGTVFTTIYRHSGTPAAIEYLLSIDFSGHNIMTVCDFPPEKQAENLPIIRTMIELYIFVLPELFYSNDKQFVRRILSYLHAYEHVISGMENYSNLALISLLRMWSGLEPYALNDICVGDLRDHGVLMMYFYLYCHEKTPHCGLWVEHALKLYYYARHMYDTVPAGYRNHFTKTPQFLFYEQFLASIQLSVFHGPLKKHLSRYKHLSLKYIQTRRNDYYKKATFWGAPSEDTVLQKAMKDALSVSGFARALYFSYDPVSGWHREMEVLGSNFYAANEPCIESLLDSVLSTQKDKIYHWRARDYQAGDVVSSAAVIPVFDISLARPQHSTTHSHSTSMHYLLALKGVFYFDTKHFLLQPDISDINHLFFLREYVGVVLHYNIVKKDLLLDKLTGLYKRDTWMEMTKKTLGLVNAQHKHLTIALLDIDFFKSVNDTHGHKTGDMVLSEVASVTMSTLRSMDISGRYGGEEFIYCFVGVSHDAAMNVAERIRHNIERSPVLAKYAVTVSIGLAFYPDDTLSLPDLIEKADQALLHAKKTGRNKCLSWEVVNNSRLPLV